VCIAVICSSLTEEILGFNGECGGGEMIKESGFIGGDREGKGSNEEGRDKKMEMLSMRRGRKMRKERGRKMRKRRRIEMRKRIGGISRRRRRKMRNGSRMKTKKRKGRKVRKEMGR